MVLIFIPLFWPVIPLILIEAAYVAGLPPYLPVTPAVAGVKVIGGIIAALLVAVAF